MFHANKKNQDGDRRIQMLSRLLFEDVLGLEKGVRVQN